MYKGKFMWTTEDGRKKLDINKIPPDFRIISQDGFHLIFPRKNLWDWKDDEKWLRSVVINNDGFVVSCSWKKFGNYGEFATDTSSLNFALKNGKPVFFSHKEDGSLCIRSVFNNQVVFRTRGTLYGGEESYGDRFKNIAKKCYPKLLDSMWMNDRSLLFEYVSPTNKVVIKYESEDLIFLGFVIHSNLHIGRWEELEDIATIANLRLVRLHNLPNDSVKLLNEVKDWKEEGIVARCEDSFGNQEQNFIKIKSAFYLANHRMKFSMKYSDIVEFIEGANIKDESQLVLELQSSNYDWEIIESAKEFYAKYLLACSNRDNLLNIAKGLVEEFFSKKLNRKDPHVRKEFAKIACSQSSIIRSMMFCLYDNNIDGLDNINKRFVLSED